MAKPVDMSKFLKTIDKSKGIGRGFHDPSIWVDTGHYLLNYFISGRFDRGVPLSKLTMVAGESGSGKSFICSGSLVRKCQEMGIMPVIIDTENAIDKEWLEDLGVDTSEDKLMKFNLAKVNDIAKVMSEFMDWYKAQFDAVPLEEQPPFLFVIDSLGMTITDNEEKQFVNGDMKGDMGIKAKQLNSLVRNTVHMISEYNIGVVATNHVYASQDMFAPDDKVSGGKLLEYGASILVAMRKGKDKDGSQVTGIKSKCQVRKSRYGRPFIATDVIIDFTKGVDPYSGLIDFFVELGLMKQGGAYVSYVTKSGEEFKDYKSKYKPEWLDIVMAEFDYDEYVLKSKVVAENQIKAMENGEEPTLGVSDEEVED